MSLKRVHDDKWVVITGGAGFIGAGLVRYLNDLGLNNIVIVDDLGSGDKWKNLVGKRYVEVVRIHELFPWLEGRQGDIQAFVHLGAISDTTETDANRLLDNNYRYSIRLAEYALRYEHRFIYASSAATYGNGSKGFGDNHELLPELEPLNMYGYSKHMFDLWALDQGVLDDIVGLKFFNIFGPNEWHKERMASLILKMVPQVQTEGVIRLFDSSEPEKYAPGEQKRDFLYVKDAVRMIHAFLGNDLGGIFNIGSGVASSWNELARAIFHALELPEHIEYVPMPLDLVKKYQNFTKADMIKHRTAKELNERVTPLHDAVLDYVTNHLICHKHW